MLEKFKPKGYDALFNVCSGKHFEYHGLKLVNSVEDTNNKMHIHVINPSSDILPIVRLVHRKSKNTTTTVEFERNTPRGFYTLAKLAKARAFLRVFNRLLIIDTTSIVTGDIEFPDADYGLHIPEEIDPSLIYITRTGKQFAVKLRNSITDTTQPSDQKQILWNAHRESIDDLRFTHLDESIIGAIEKTC